MQVSPPMQTGAGPSGGGAPPRALQQQEQRQRDEGRVGRGGSVQAAASPAAGPGPSMGLARGRTPKGSAGQGAVAETSAAAQQQLSAGVAGPATVAGARPGGLQVGACPFT